VRLRRRPGPNTGQLAENWQPKLWLRLIVLGLLVAYVIAFVLENRKGVHVHFVLVTASVSLIWVILLSLALGLLAGMLAAQLDRRRRRRRAAE
jgi:uncharacterized integral membrane protein